MPSWWGGVSSSTTGRWLLRPRPSGTGRGLSPPTRTPLSRWGRLAATAPPARRTKGPARRTKGPGRDKGAGTENKGAGTENKGADAQRSSGVEGLLPGAGALVAFIATASGRRPEVAGKPQAPMAALVKERYGRLSVVAGDQPDTDGLFAKTTAAKFALVLSGVTRQSDLPVKPVPDLVGADLLSVVEQFLRAARS